MSKRVKETQIQYDAFISYRHCPEDKRVAERLQRLLEKCRIVDADTGKKRYLHIFRDQSELPTSNDLGTSIRTALENSRFLIILYSRTTKESKWCMEELNYFRFLHHNTNQNILPMLLEGEPDEVFPDILRWEPRQMLDEDGESRSVQVEVEPLGADIRADSYHAKQKKLCRTEYMRIAAPIMGCRYDDLYRRAFRQKVRNGVLVGGIMFLICFLIVLLFVNQYHSKLTKAAVYQVMAGQYADKKDWQSALMYYNEAMKRDTSLDSASLAAALLLQERQWPCVMHIDENQYIGKNGALWSFEEVQHIETSAQEDLLVRDCNRDYYLCKYSGIVDRYAVYDREGGRTAVLENVGYLMLDSFGQDYWGFYQDGMVTLYEPSKDVFCSFSIDWSTEYKGLVHVIPAGEDACLVMNEEEDSIALYQISFADGKGQLVEKVFLDQLFKERYEKERYIYGQTAAGSFLFQVSPRQDAVIVGRTVADIDDSWSDVIVLQLPDLTCKTLISDEHYYLNNIAFRADGGRFALAYGNGIGTLYAGGYAAVYELSGEVEFRTEIDEDCAYYGAVFRDEESGEIVLWGQRELQFWNYQDGTEYAVAVKLPRRIAEVICTQDAHCIVEAGGDLYYYNIASFRVDDVDVFPDDPYSGLELVEADDAGISLMVAQRFLVRFEEGINEAGTPVLHIILRNPDGIICDELHIEYEGGDWGEFYWNYNFSPDLSTLYICMQGFYTYRIAILPDKIKFAECEKLDSSYWLYGFCPVEDGIVVLSIDSELYYYGNNKTSYQSLGDLRAAGKVNGLATNRKDSFVLYLGSQSRNVFEYWNLETQSYIMDFEIKKDEIFTKFGFISDDILLYGTEEDISLLLLISEPPDMQAQKALRAICGMMIADEKTQYVQEIFDGNMGNWSSLQVHLR